MGRDDPSFLVGALGDGRGREFTPPNTCASFSSTGNWPTQYVTAFTYSRSPACLDKPNRVLVSAYKVLTA